MIIPGRFKGNAPFFSLHLESPHFEGDVWFLADIGAARTSLLDWDVMRLRIARDVWQPAGTRAIGIGGTVTTYIVRDVRVTFATLAPESQSYSFQHDVYIVEHPLEELPLDDVSRLLRLPSLLGRDIINRFEFLYDYQLKLVQLARKSWHEKISGCLT